MESPLQRKSVVYCGACGMPPEYCEYCPDFESHCMPWLQKNQPDWYSKLKELRKGGGGEDSDGDNSQVIERPSDPWTTEERLIKFYEQYQPEKVDGVGAILEKYAGKEEKLFMALVKKYGPEPEDPFYAESSDDEEDVGIEGGVADLSVNEKKKRRGAGAKKESKTDTRVIIQKISRNKRKAVTIIIGMDTVPGIKLKDVSKVCSKRFAGSSSVKDKKEIIIQGDHMDEAAALLVDKFNVPANAVFLDIDGEFIPFKQMI